MLESKGEIMYLIGNNRFCNSESQKAFLAKHVWIQNVFPSSSKVIEDIGDKALHVIMDDTVYKMSSFQNPVIGRSAVKILMYIVNHDNAMIKVIVKRYQGQRHQIVALLRQFTNV